MAKYAGSRTVTDGPGFAPGSSVTLGLTPRNRKRSKLVDLREWAGISAIALPAMTLYTLAILLPPLLALRYSVTDWDGISRSYSFEGLRQYRLALTDPDARHALWVTGVFTVATVVPVVTFSLALAMALLAPTRINIIYRTIVFLPVVLSSVVVGFIWKNLLGTSGVADTIYQDFTSRPAGLNLLGRETSALIVLIGVVIWQSLGFTTVIFLAGLLTVPAELYEAARLDGAGAWQRFRSVTWPMVAPATTIAVVSAVIGGLQEYDRVAALTGGGPAGGTKTVAFKVVNDAFTSKFAFACAEGVLLIVGVGFISILLIGFLRRREAHL